MNRLSVYVFIAFLLQSTFSFSQINDPSVFHSNRGEESKWLLYKNNNQALYKIITNEAFQLLDERSEQIAKLNTKDDWINYQSNLKTKVFTSLQHFKKTPLNVQVTGKIERETFWVEKILFESQPDFFVTGCLFIPKNIQIPAPAIIYCSGHTELGFRSDVYQHVILNLVEKGFVVYGMDPIGQGERLQYVNHETGKSKIGSSTKEHTFAGVQMLLTGTSLSDYFIWDGVRTVDFLLTRKEIDPERIGSTGRSGGGTQSAMIAAYDNRIYAAAPECYITTFKRLLQSIGPQDAEQNPFHAIKLGFDHPDFLHLRAPLPSLIITTTHDFFSQQGARECFVEAQKSYAAFGNSENIEIIEDYGEHESTKNNREAMYAFFQKHLKLKGNNLDVEVELFKPEELWVTKTGQLQSSDIGKTTFQLNQENYSKKGIPKNQLKEKIMEFSGINFDNKLTTAVYTGKYLTEKLEIKKYFLESSKNEFALPVYVVKNDNSTSDKVLLWISSDGKKSVIENEKISQLLDKGYTIVSPDLPGIGELFDPEFSGDGFISGVPFNYTFGAHLVGKSIPGIQAEAINLAVQFIKKEKDLNAKPIYAWAENEVCSSFLHYLVFENPFKEVTLLNPLKSYKNLIETEYYDPKQAYYVVPGSLPFYDFEDLISFLPKENIEIITEEDIQ